MGRGNPESHDVTRGAPSEAPAEHWSDIFRHMTAGQRNAYEKFFDEAAEPGTQDARSVEGLDTPGSNGRYTPWNYFDSYERFQNGFILLEHGQEVWVMDREGFPAHYQYQNENEREIVVRYLQELDQTKSAVDVEYGLFRALMVRPVMKRLLGGPEITSAMLQTASRKTKQAIEHARGQLHGEGELMFIPQAGIFVLTVRDDQTFYSGNVVGIDFEGNTTPPLRYLTVDGEIDIITRLESLPHGTSLQNFERLPPPHGAE